MSKAKNLTDMVRVFDPVQPLSGTELTEFYVDRQSEALAQMETRLRVARKDEPIKLLFTGQRGCGKSTELAKLAHNLRRHYFIVPFSVQRQRWPIAELTYSDLILGMASALFRQATEKHIITQAPAQILDDTLDDIRLFFENTVFGPEIPYRVPERKLENSVKVNALAIELQTKFSAEGVTRDGIRKRLERRMGELIGKIDMMADQVQIKYKRPVLFLVEDTDKPDLERARAIFLGYGATLTAMHASVIYTIPVGLRYSADFNAIQSHFSDSFFLPNIRLKHKDGMRDHDGYEQLANAITNRLAVPLIDAAAQTALLEASGGLMRILIRLTQRAAVRALAQDRERVTLADAQASIEKDRGDLTAMLSPVDYATLAARHLDKRLMSGDAITQQLLHALALLEYRNGDSWCDVNPLLLPSLQELGLAAA